MSKPLISVIIPLYNGIDHIIKCLDKLDIQNCDFPYEVLIVDDCSTDNSVDSIEEHKQKLKHPDLFRVVCSERNGRAGAARNIGLKLAKGHYILFHDQDDYADTNLLNILWNYSKNGEVDLVSCAVMDKTGKIYYRPEIESNHNLTEQERNNALVHYGYVFASLIKRSVLVDNNITFPENVMFEDCLYNTGLIACVETVQTIREVLYFREDDDYSQTAFFSRKKLNDRIDATKYYLQQFQHNRKTVPYYQVINLNAFYYIYLSVMFWLLAIPKLYSRALFVRCLREGKKLSVSWRDVINAKFSFSRPLLYLLKIIYFVPLLEFPVRLMGTTAYRIRKVLKKRKGR